MSGWRHSPAANNGGTMAKNEAVETETQDSGDAPLIDLNDASIKKLIARGGSQPAARRA